MTDLIGRLAAQVQKRLQTLELPVPNISVIRSVIGAAHSASMRTEEGRFVRASLTFADPQNLDLNGPPLKRAYYPAFTPFFPREQLTSEKLVKLARAIDRWSGSIAVYGKTKSNVFAWGVLDQLVHQNIRINREAHHGFSTPGIFTVTIDGIAEVSVYHGDLLLGAIRGHKLVDGGHDILRSVAMFDRAQAALRPIANAIVKVIGVESKKETVRSLLFGQWASTLARLCIGLRRMGTGGSLLITTSPKNRFLDVCHQFEYGRLSEAVILGVLDSRYASKTQTKYRQGAIGLSDVREMQLAETDMSDRELELTGAVKVVTALAALDGLVLLDWRLNVKGFGVKIGSTPPLRDVYDGGKMLQEGRAASRRLDLSRFGTRHLSMLRYCQQDPLAFGLVVSQDGQVRLITMVGRELTMFDNVKLLGYENFTAAYCRMLRTLWERRRVANRPHQLGYTSTPKSVESLIASAGVPPASAHAARARPSGASRVTSKAAVRTIRNRGRVAPNRASRT